MRLRPRMFFALGFVLIASTACTHHRVQNVPIEGFFEAMATCRDEFAALDARVAAAGVQDSAYYRVPGFPYFRTDRLLASYANEVTDFEQLSGWIRRMRELDQEAREFEYMNLGMSTQEAAISRSRMQLCSSTLAGLELEVPSNMTHLKSVVMPPAEYSTTRRALGLYPLSVPILRSRIEAKRENVRADFATPLAELETKAPLTLWSVTPSMDPELIKNGFNRSVVDELGFPGLVASQWLALAEAYAPHLWIESASESDVPGSPEWTESGISVDTNNPVLNYHISFARFGGQPVVQITYFTWFKGRLESLPIDGTMWRVTLNLDAEPMLYESIHTSGQSHQVFPVQALQRREHEGYFEQAPFFPQSNGSIPARNAALRLKAGSHELRRVVFEIEAKAQEKKQYTLQRYEELYFLKKPGGGTRSLFSPEGLIAQTERPDDSWMFASGVRQPGALRQYGRHPIGYIGNSHFDDPFLLETIFVAPTTEKPRQPAG